MNTLKPDPDILTNGQALLENIGEMLEPLLDMSDQATSDFYWTFAAMNAASMLAQLEALERLEKIKLLYPPPVQK